MAKPTSSLSLMERAQARDTKGANAEPTGNPVALAKAIVKHTKEIGTFNLMGLMFNSVDITNGIVAGYDKSLIRANFKRPIFWCVNSVPSNEMTNKGELAVLLAETKTSLDQLIKSDEALALLGLKA